MSTRSLTVFVDNQSHQEIAVMYRQHDGYPEGYGYELSHFLKGTQVINGINLGSPPSAHTKQANGMSCLSASIIAHFKEGIGNVYLYPASTRNCGEEWIYTVYAETDSEVNISVIDAYASETIFDGTASQMVEWLKSKNKE